MTTVSPFRRSSATRSAGFVEAGESLLVVRDDVPLAEITPAAARRRGSRPVGLCAGEFVVPDDFDDLLVTPSNLP